MTGKARRSDITLASAAEYDRCLARPALVRNGPFALHLCWRSGSTDESTKAAMNPSISASMTDAAWRLGLVIPKRYEASAVARNTIKRRWRAAFRQGRAAWADEFGSADVVVRMQSPLIKKADAAKKAAAPAVVMPARVRARERFDPQAGFASLAERLRSRGERKSARAGDVVVSALPAVSPNASSIPSSLGSQS
jgi:ribonuclease P protein component